MTTNRVSFTNRLGRRLDGRMELPADGSPQAFAVFAHCFTCNKHQLSAVRVSRVLADAGFGVLRFDFTGLGESEGEFEEGTFTSNVSDLVDAAEWLGQEYQAPKLLVGHSLGGTAALEAAGQIESVEAVTTIGSPATPEHLMRLFEGHMIEIEEEGAAEVCIEGRPFRITRQFIEDLERPLLEKSLGAMNRALLILHSPLDDIVSIDNAKTLFELARHPKSFVSLDKADHLLSDTNEARYVGRLIAAWASKLL